MSEIEKIKKSLGKVTRPRKFSANEIKLSNQTKDCIKSLGKSRSRLRKDRRLFMATLEELKQKHLSKVVNFQENRKNQVSWVKERHRYLEKSSLWKQI